MKSHQRAACSHTQSWPRQNHPGSFGSWIVEVGRVLPGRWENTFWLWGLGATYPSQKIGPYRCEAANPTPLRVVHQPALPDLPPRSVTLAWRAPTKVSRLLLRPQDTRVSVSVPRLLLRPCLLFEAAARLRGAWTARTHSLSQSLRRPVPRHRAGCRLEISAPRV